MSNYSITPAYVLTVTGETVSQALIDIAEEYVEGWARQNWREEVAVAGELYSGDGTGILKLKQYPLITFSSLEEYNSGNDEWDEIEINDDDFEYEKETGYVYYTGGFLEGHENYRVGYTYGKTNGCPARVKVVIARTAVYLKANPTGAAAENIGGISVTHNPIENLWRDVPRRVFI